jgi:hypothetical protein
MNPSGKMVVRDMSPAAKKLNQLFERDFVLASRGKTTDCKCQ